MKMFNALFAIIALSFSLNSFAIDEDNEMLFKDALIEGKLQEVQKFVTAEPSLVNQKFFGWTPLQMAANTNQVKVVEYLVSKGADMNYIQPNAHHTAFHLAAFNGHKETVEYLAKAGADVNVKLKGDVSIVRYFRDEGIPSWVELLTKLGVKDDGCEEECF